MPCVRVPLENGRMRKARALMFATAALVAASASVAPAQETGGDATAAETPSASARLAEKYPFLDPDWSSTSFFPPEYCRYLIRIDRSDAIYWQIKRWCDTKNRRRR